MTRLSHAVTRLCLAGVFAVGLAPAASVPALADPPAPEPTLEPAAPPPNSGIGSVLAQNGSAPTGPLGLPDLSAYAPGLLLAQNVVPAAPGVPTPLAAPDLRAFGSEYLLPQNVAPAAPGQGVPDDGIGPSPDDPGTGRLAFLRRLHAMYQDGGLTGALLGQLPAEQLGEALPGTAPGPGIYLPPGLGGGLAEPAPVPAPPG